MLPTMILEHIPNIFGAIFLSSLLAVIMGTADSTLLVSAVMGIRICLSFFEKRPD
jgi:Na+/pantothenate symporter